MVFANRKKSCKNWIYFHGQGLGQGQCRIKVEGHGQGQCRGTAEGHGQGQCTILEISKRTVDKKVHLLACITQKQIKNRFIFYVTPLGIHHSLHLAWHGSVE